MTTPPSSGMQPRARSSPSLTIKMVSIMQRLVRTALGSLTASADKTAKLWDAASGKLVVSFDHQDEVFQAAFSPDGARILTASADKTAKLWDAATPVELARQVKESGGDIARMGSSVSMAGSPALQVESLSVYRKRTPILNDGSLVAVDEKRRSKLTKQLKDLAQDLRPDARFMRWFFIYRQ